MPERRQTVEMSFDGVEVEGTAFQGVIKGNPATTTYWSQAFLERPVWISTQNGLPFNVSETCTLAGPLPVNLETRPGSIVIFLKRGLSTRTKPLPATTSATFCLKDFKNTPSIVSSGSRETAERRCNAALRTIRFCSYWLRTSARWKASKPCSAFCKGHRVRFYS